MQAQNVDGGQAGKSSPAGGKRKALRIIEPSAQGPSHAYSPVVGGAAAHSDDDATISPIQSALDELAGAVGGGVTGVSVLVGKERQPRRLGHLYNGSLAVPHDSPASLHALAQWAVYSAGEGLPRRGLNQGVQGAVSSVGHGDQDCLRLGKDAKNPFLNGSGSLRSGHASLEGLWRNDYPHDVKLYTVVYYDSALC